MVIPTWAGVGGGADSLLTTSFIGLSTTLASEEAVLLLACRPAVVPVISFFYLDERLSHKAFKLEEVVLGVVPKGDRERRRLDAAVTVPRV